MKIEMNASIMDSMVRDWLANEDYIQDDSGNYVKERIANEAWTDWKDVVVRETMILDGDPYCDGGIWYQDVHDEEGHDYSLVASDGNIEVI